MKDSNDKYINQFLGKPISSVDDIMSDKQGVVGLLTNAFYSGLAGFLMLSNVLILVFTALLVWSGFHFFTSTTSEDMIFWGICCILSVQVQVALKQWLWTQIDRSSILRKLKRTQRAIIAMDKTQVEEGEKKYGSNTTDNMNSKIGFFVQIHQSL